MNPGVVDWKKVNLYPENTFKKTENCNYVVRLCQSMGISLQGICGKDIEEGKPNLTFGNILHIIHSFQISTSVAADEI